MDASPRTVTVEMLRREGIVWGPLESHPSLALGGKHREQKPGVTLFGATLVNKLTSHRLTSHNLIRHRIAGHPFPYAHR